MAGITVTEVKVIVLVVLFIFTYLFALLPIWLMRLATRSANIERRRKFDVAIR